jgi:flagellar motor switch/type III secretory pathway protein FliN
MTGTELATRSLKAGRTTNLDFAGAAPVAWIMRIEEHPCWGTLAQLRVVLRASVVLERFRVRDLLEMKVGQVFESSSLATDDVPVKIGQVQLGWSEFEVLEQKMAFRLTRLG